MTALTAVSVALYRARKSMQGEVADRSPQILNKEAPESWQNEVPVIKLFQFMKANVSNPQHFSLYANVLKVNLTVYK